MYAARYEKYLQNGRRLGADHVRHLMAAYRAGDLNAEDVAAEMAMTRRARRQDRRQAPGKHRAIN